MTATVVTLNKLGYRTTRPSDDELHRAACKALDEGGHAIFRMLPSLIEQIIDHKVWKTRPKGFKSFGEYALDQTSDGLGVGNNQVLWMLRCALDVHGKHVGEWASVLEHVEKSSGCARKGSFDGRNSAPFRINDLALGGRYRANPAATFAFSISNSPSRRSSAVRITSPRRRRDSRLPATYATHSSRCAG